MYLIHLFLLFQYFQEKLFKGDWKKCERQGNCDGRFGVEKTKCIRQCMAPSCYDEIYGYDEVSPPAMVWRNLNV